ncbi:hypothetical protein NM688_g4880 [Phlebia brevispora]|uniref:Uncharacterized protein n=1 Tax=Phlebia brevispora TaxID=194682 RepID=A0ACC1T1U6_9APHY|nr:hypothetical protein NM688_g4880 [Phlebia brevispora]
MSRLEGRKNEQLRTTHIKYEGLDRVDGSARFGFGETESLASVSGPIEVRPNSESPSQATLEVHIRPLAAIAGTDSKALSATLKSILIPALLLSQHPRTLVQIVGQALCGSESGAGYGSAGRGWHASLVASLINACSAALVNASSVPMKGVVCAVAIGRLRDPSSSLSSPTLVLDPSEAELSRLVGGGCFAFMFSSTLSKPLQSDADVPSSSLLWTNYTAMGGAFGDAEFEEARQLAENGATLVWQSFKDSLQNGQVSRPATELKKKALDEEPVDDEKMEI